jgi:hypothetical protein
MGPTDPEKRRDWLARRILALKDEIARDPSNAVLAEDVARLTEELRALTRASAKTPSR